MTDDLISRTALLSDARRLIDCDDDGKASPYFINAVEVAAINAAPAVNAIEVVRCNDCKYFKWGVYCVHDKMEHSKCRKDDFCSYGEKRNQDKASYSEVLPRFEDFHERNDECTACPFYDEECSGDADKRCLSADILELLKRGAMHEREQ